MPAESDEEYDPRVDAVACIWCDLCEKIMPEVFRMADHRGVAFVHDADGWKPDDADRLREAEVNCPVNAIHLDAE